MLLYPINKIPINTEFVDFLCKTVIEIVLFGDDALSDEINLTNFKSVRLCNTLFPILLNFL